jgi:triosephosphate isomerase (TIM)
VGLNIKLEGVMIVQTAYTIIGNWKMYFSYKQAIKWAYQQEESLRELTKLTRNALVLCPSFESLQSLHTILKNTCIGLGAQNCSEHSLGAYTGQISAQSLAEIGCSYCIIGHSEQREYGHEMHDQISQKMVQLSQYGIKPIVCIGESKKDFDQRNTLSILENQLIPICNALQELNYPAQHLFIAYEPIWAIGTSIIPETTHLEKVFAHIKKIASSRKNHYSISLLYGGSVTSLNCKKLKEVENIEGFLIGKASTDFQELKKIVLSV